VIHNSACVLPVRFSTKRDNKIQAKKERSYERSKYTLSRRLQFIRGSLLQKVQWLMSQTNNFRSLAWKILLNGRERHRC
jgi:hypothetical protein